MMLDVKLILRVMLEKSIRTAKAFYNYDNSYNLQDIKGAVSWEIS